MPDDPLSHPIFTALYAAPNPHPNPSPVFFNRGSTEPKGSASGIQGFRGTACAQQKKLNCVQHLRPLDAFSRLLVGPSVLVVAPLTPLWELTVLPQTSYLAGRASLPPPQEEPLLRISALRPQKTHGFRGQSKLLQRVPLH